MNPPAFLPSFLGALALGAALTVSSVALAEPLVTMADGAAQPGVVTEWSGKGKKVTLSVKDGADAAAVAEAIESGVDRVRVKVAGGKILVIGKTQDDLLAALAEVDFGGGDDLGLLAAASLDDGIDSGSSLRAKKTGDLKKLFKDRATVARGQVVGVRTGAFPKVIVKVRILSGPTGELGKTIRKGKTIAFVPAFEMNKKGKPKLSDTETQTNLGAYFMKKGDRVKVKVGQALKKGRYEAVVITR